MSFGNNYPRQDDIPLRKAVDFILTANGTGADPRIGIPARRTQARRGTPVAEPEAAPAPVTPMSPALDIAPTAVADAAVQSWELGDDSYLDYVSLHVKNRIMAMKSNWAIEPSKIPVFVGDRVYLHGKDASEANGSQSGIGAAINRGATAYKGKKIGYADPMLEAIRMGMSRQEWKELVNPTAKDTIRVQGTQGSVLDEPAVTTPAPKHEPTHEAGDRVVASLVMSEDGARLELDREVDLATAERVIEFAKAVLAKGAKVQF